MKHHEGAVTGQHPKVPSQSSATLDLPPRSIRVGLSLRISSHAPWVSTVALWEQALWDSWRRTRHAPSHIGRGARPSPCPPSHKTKFKVTRSLPRGHK